ncbi:hypothetical protein BKA69DRAFT_1153542 [Paraphysoderma sedebokerense]|nr:hypothetical protein BKA69DRAFT_1153542 [Paraphysoderma sedebokerense]
MPPKQKSKPGAKPKLQASISSFLAPNQPKPNEKGIRQQTLQSFLKKKEEEKSSEMESESGVDEGTSPNRMDIDVLNEGPRQKKRKMVIDSDDEDDIPKSNTICEGSAIKHSPPDEKENNLKAEIGGVNNSESPKKKIKVDELEDVPKQEESEESKSDGLPEKESADMDVDEVEGEKEVARMAMSLLSQPAEQVATWKKGEKVPYAALCKAFEAIDATTKRLEILSILTNFLRTVIELSPHNLLETVYLCLNRICPEYEGLELGIGESLLIKAIADACGRSVAKIKGDLVEIGDLGSVAQSSRGNQRTMFTPKPLSVPQVFNVLKEIANISGGSSQKLKVDKIKNLLVSCRGNEPKYLIRSLEGKLRIGLAEKTILVALSQAAVLSKNAKKDGLEARLAQASEIIKSVYSELPSYDLIVPALLQHPIDELPNHCHLTPGIPLKPMLAHPTKSITEVLDRFEGKTFTCEYKYDGERAQVHKLENGQSFVFSRNSENLSKKYPDIMDRLDKIAKPTTNSFVLDCECVAWDPEKKCILPFQVLSTRKRKDVSKADITVQVCLFAFDLLYLNGKVPELLPRFSLLQESLHRRRELMYESFNLVEGEFAFAKHMDANSVDEIQTFLEESIVNNCEGLMVKTLETESSYEPSKRSRNWLKVKKDYLDGAGDSLDLVVIGGYIGKGKRTGMYGGFLLACYDDRTEEFQSICKIGTGFSDEDLAKHAEFFKQHIIEAPKPYYKIGDAKAEVWFDAVQVWEVKTADLSVSPVYQAGIGLVDPSKGISLRFPRFIRIRDDKSPETATTASQVADMYKNQQINANTGGGKDDEGADDGFEY